MLFVVFFVLVAAALYRLTIQGKDIVFKDFSYKLNSELCLKSDSLIISYAKDIRSFHIFLPEATKFYNNDKVLASIKNLSLNVDLPNYFRKLNIPVDLKADELSLIVDDMASNNNADKTLPSHLNSLKKNINRFSQNRAIFLRSAKIENGSIKLSAHTATFSLASELSPQNTLHSEFLISYDNLKSEVSLDISNDTHIDSKLTVKKFPIELLAAMMPRDYQTKYMIRAYDGVLLTGELRYVVDTSTEANILALKFVNQQDLSKKRSDDLDSIELNLTSDRNFHNINLVGFKLNLLDSTNLVADAQIKQLTAKSYKVAANAKLKNMPIDSLEMFWPNGVAPDTRSWLLDSLRAGVVDNANCKVAIEDSSRLGIEDIKAELNFSNISLNYYDQHSQLDRLNGKAVFNGDTVKIAINEGYVKEGKIFSSTVEIKYGEEEMPLIINAKTTGKAVNYLGFVDSDVILRIEKKGLALSEIKGDVNGTVNIEIPLAKEITLANTMLDVNAQLTNLDLVYKRNVNISGGEIKLGIDNQKVSLNGAAKLNKQPATLVWESNLLESKPDVFDHKLLLKLDLGPNSLLEDLTKQYCRIEQGVGKVDLTYFSYPEKESIDLNADLSAAEFRIPMINLKKENNQAAKFTLHMTSVNNNNWVADDVSLTSGNVIKLNGTGEFDYDFMTLANLKGDVKYIDNNFSVEYSDLEAKTSLNITGKKIDLSQMEMNEMFAGNKSKKNRDSSFHIALDAAQMPNDVILNKVKANLVCANNICTNGSMQAKLGNDADLNIKINTEDGLSQWHITSNDAAAFLKAFKIYKNIRAGELEINLKQVSPKKTQIEPIYSGELILTNFTATKTPILAKLISFSSFRGILSILQSYTSIPFRKMKAEFILADKVIRLNNTYVTGDYLTLTASGVVDLNKEYMNIYGKVVPPVYGLNYVLSLIPFIGHKLAGDDGKKGLIAANYKVYGQFGKTTAFVNPMSLIIPEFFSTEIMEAFIP